MYSDLQLLIKIMSACYCGFYMGGVCMWWELTIFWKLIWLIPGLIASGVAYICIRLFFERWV